MMKALLVTPLPPQPTGLADYARRILGLTAGHVEWTVAYPPGGAPVPECRCLPIGDLQESDFQGTVVYQAGNSPHCADVVRTLSIRRGKVLFHETNLHHLLRQMAHETGEWSEYASHVKADYGRDSDHVLKVMGRRAKSLPEYDMRLRKYPLLGRLAHCATSIAVLSDTAGYRLQKLHPERKIHRMGFLADFLGRVQAPEPDGGPPVIGIAGTFHYGRNWEAMSQAVAELREHHEVRLLAAGGGWPETGHSWIETTGRLSDMDFRRSIERFHIAIDMRHHTCSETSGSMMDILRSGKPAVLSDEGSFRDIPACAVLRIPSESGAAGAFAALKYLMDNPEVARSIGDGAAEYFRRTSDRDQCLQQWMSFLEAGEE